MIPRRNQETNPHGHDSMILNRFTLWLAGALTLIVMLAYCIAR
jgi:hypothetical protein